MDKKEQTYNYWKINNILIYLYLIRYYFPIFSGFHTHSGYISILKSLNYQQIVKAFSFDRQRKGNKSRHTIALRYFLKKNYLQKLQITSYRPIIHLTIHLIN